MLNLSSCGVEADALKAKFAGNAADNSIAVVWESTFYFADHTLELADIVTGETPNHGYWFMDDKLYFSTHKELGTANYSLLIYTCDIYGNNKQLVFEQQGYKTVPWTVGNDGVIYVEHYEDNAFKSSSRRIDAYNIKTGTYDTVTTGENAGLSDFAPAQKGTYTSTFEDSVLTITDPLKNTQYTIDGALLHNSNFGDVLADLDYGYYSMYAANGRIWLLYRIESGAPPYPYFVCEYLPSENEVVFSALLFVVDCEGLKMMCI